MAPHEEPKARDGQARHRDKLITENSFLGEAGHELADDTHGRQNHDVNGRMRIKPEHMLEQNRVSPFGSIKYSKTKQPFQSR
jgi:hypothetical protein